MAVRSFVLLKESGVRTHFLEQTADDTIRIQLLEVDTDASLGPTGPGQTIPLQVIYRLALPKESSVHRRARASTLDRSTVPPYEEAGPPWLAAPMVEFTTKYEETDRFIGRAEAGTVGAIGAADIATVAGLTERVARTLDRHCADVGLTLVDGKAEFGFDGDRAPILIDHVGTPDENRFYLGDVPVCKELLRYLHPGLREVVQGLIAENVPRADWPVPPPLPPAQVTATADVYAQLAAVWDGADPAALQAAVRDFRAAAGSDLSERIGL